jgi:hypothetical protein
VVWLAQLFEEQPDLICRQDARYAEAPAALAHQLDGIWVVISHRLAF